MILSRSSRGRRFRRVPAAQEAQRGSRGLGGGPRGLGGTQLAGLVASAIAESGASGPGGMGLVMKTVTPRVAGRAEGARVAAEVRRQLAAGS